MGTSSTDAWVHEIVEEKTAILREEINRLNTEMRFLKLDISGINSDIDELRHRMYQIDEKED